MIADLLPGPGNLAESKQVIEICDVVLNHRDCLTRFSLRIVGIPVFCYTENFQRGSQHRIVGIRLHFAQLIDFEPAIDSTRIMNFHPVVKHEDLYGHALCMDAVIPMDERVIQHFRDTSFYAFVVQETFPDGADIPQFVTGNDDSGNAQLWKICLWIQTKGQRAVHCGYRSDTSYERLHNCRFRTQSSVRHCPRCG